MNELSLNLQRAWRGGFFVNKRHAFVKLGKMTKPFWIRRIKHYVGVHAKMGIHVVFSVPRELPADANSARKSAVMAEVFIYALHVRICFTALVQIHGEHTSTSGAAKGGVEGVVVEHYKITRVCLKRNVAGNL